jgi:hypothetical protein
MLVGRAQHLGVLLADDGNAGARRFEGHANHGLGAEVGDRDRRAVLLAEGRELLALGTHGERQAGGSTHCCDGGGAQHGTIGCIHA